MRLAEDEDENIRLIFVDAICINQTGTDERNIQVSLMGEIYKRAAKVMVWIDPSLSRWVVEELQRLAKVYIAQRLKTSSKNERPSQQLGNRRKEVYKLLKADGASDYLTFEFQPPPENGVQRILQIEEMQWPAPRSDSNDKSRSERSAAFARLQNFINVMITMNSYWNRLWIIQEVLLARELEFWFLTWKWPERNLTQPFTLGKAVAMVDSFSKGWTVWIHDAFKPRLLPDVINMATDFDKDLHFTQSHLPCQKNHEREVPTARHMVFNYLRADFQDQAKGIRLDFAQALTISHYAQCDRIEDRVLGIMGITRMHRAPHYGMSQELLFIDIAANYVAAVRPWGAWFAKAFDDPKYNLQPALRGLTAVIFAFEIPTAHAWVMLVFSIALDIFGFPSTESIDLAISYERMHVEAEFTDEDGKLKIPKTFYRSRNKTLQKLSRVRGESKMRKLMQIKDENGWIWCPLPTLDGGDARHGEHYLDWVNLIRARMMLVWHYYQEQDGQPHEVEPILSACWTTESVSPFDSVEPSNPKLNMTERLKLRTHRLFPA
jgi:hypothetical protein